MVSFSDSAGRVSLSMTAQVMGKDVNVSLFGGEVPHIGVVALAQSRESLKGDGEISATCSVLAVCGHKEDELARHVAQTLAKRLNCLASVACGIHPHAIAPEELSAVHDLVDRLLDNVTRSLAC